jgi:hypothetical protein
MRERDERLRHRHEGQSKQQRVTLSRARDLARLRYADIATRMAKLAQDNAAQDDAAQDDAAAPLRGQLDELWEAAKTAASQASSASIDSALTSAIERMNRAEEQFIRLRTRVAAQGRLDTAARLAALDAVLDEVKPEVRVRFDATGAAEVDTLLDPAPTTAAQVEQLSARIEQHLCLVVERRNGCEELRRRAAALVEQLTGRLAALDADAVRAKVLLPDGDAARTALGTLRGELLRERFDEVVRTGERVGRKLDEIEAELDATIDRISARRVILGSLVRALPSLGFAVDPQSLAESADGAIGLRARRVGGEGVTVVVEPADDTSDRVLYTSDRMEREERAGRPEAGCPSLLEIISEVNRSAERDGVVLSAVSWQGREDQPQPGAARRVAPGGDSGRHREDLS